MVSNGQRTHWNAVGKISRSRFHQQNHQGSLDSNNNYKWGQISQNATGAIGASGTIDYIVLTAGFANINSEILSMTNLNLLSSKA